MSTFTKKCDWKQPGANTYLEQDQYGLALMILPRKTGAFDFVYKRVHRRMLVNKAPTSSCRGQGPSSGRRISTKLDVDFPNHRGETRHGRGTSDVIVMNQFDFCSGRRRPSYFDGADHRHHSSSLSSLLNFVFVIDHSCERSFASRLANIRW